MIFIDGRKPQILSGEHLFKTFDDCLHLAFYKQENRFVKVLESYNDSLWINLDEVNDKDNWQKWKAIDFT